MMAILDQLCGKRIAVLGDIMLDVYLTGTVDRISPEAPVPVVRVDAERFVPGGAANVAANLAMLGARVLVAGYLGDDRSRESLLEALAALPGVDVSGLVTVPGRRTTCKMRIVGAHQQVVRVDQEDRGVAGGEHEQRLIAAALDRIVEADVVVLSDYGKGVCSDLLLRATIDGARRLGRPVLVDPKRTDLAAYCGATILTPNRAELTAATGLPCETDAEAAAAAAAAQKVCEADILLTRSEKGMSLFPLHGEPVHLPTLAQDVFDVSGAGDTVVAAMAAGTALGLPMGECMRLANHAAGIVVAKRGTATVSPEELGFAVAADRSRAMPEDGRLLDRNALVALRASWRRERLTVGLANGCFDLLHPGHVALIREAAARCDRLVLALNSDASTRRLKGPARPVQSETARAQVVGAIKGVAAVTLFGEDTPRALIEALQPDLLVKGADYALADVVGADIVQGRGGRVLLVPLESAHSTTALVAAANR